MAEYNPKGMTDQEFADFCELKTEEGAIPAGRIDYVSGKVMFRSGGRLSAEHPGLHQEVWLRSRARMGPHQGLPEEDRQVHRARVRSPTSSPPDAPRSSSGGTEYGRRGNTRSRHCDLPGISWRTGSDGSWPQNSSPAQYSSPWQYAHLPYCLSGKVRPSSE